MRQFIDRMGEAADRSVGQQVRRDLLILAGFLAAGYILSINLDVVGLLSALVGEHTHLPLGRLFGTIIIAGLGLALYGLTRTYDTMNVLRRRVRAEDRARRLAMHDQLTGLPNRRHLKGVLNWLLGNSDGVKPVAVITINLDDFKTINDVHGRAGGDELLLHVTNLLNLRAGADGFVAKIDADEFVVVLQDWDEDQLIDWLSALLTAIEAPMIRGEQEISISATAGVAMAPVDGRDAETLLHRADLAVRRAKESSRGWFGFFKAGMDERVHERALFERDLWAAISADEIEPYFQPVVSLANGKVCGFEILARWTHVERGVVAPDRFIPVAEASDMIGDLTLNLLRKACRDALNWNPELYISLNLSPAQLNQGDLAQCLLNVLGETGFPANRLEIELTEAALVSDLDAARAALSALKAEGVRIALDNFGVGHSTLHQLRQLPFDKLKIDRSYVGRVTEDKEALVLLRTMIAMADGLSLEVVAEGIETMAQARALVGLGCDFGQGNLFGEAAVSPAAKRGSAEMKAAKELAPV